MSDNCEVPRRWWYTGKEALAMSDIESYFCPSLCEGVVVGPGLVPEASSTEEGPWPWQGRVGRGHRQHTGSPNPVGCSDTHSGPACSPWDTRGAPRRHPAPTPQPQRALSPAVGLQAWLGYGAGESCGAAGCRAAPGGGGPFKRGGGGTMAIITLALEVTPGPLRFHLGRGRGDGPLPGGGGDKGGGRRGGAARPGSARPGAARCSPLPGVTAGAGTGAAAAAAAGPRRFLPPPLKVRGGRGAGWGATRPAEPGEGALPRFWALVEMRVWADRAGFSRCQCCSPTGAPPRISSVVIFLA
ncbi:LOW QUALITY PROTEIN: uncharacterized protein LOC141743088 [Larus michahellis]|uniref:LOW QUALITY PROTEIN: uncharacterized protein LOC141743088 n=1 Tax=Larus michahellis TaxID=119627 RepID=UPI003D9B9F47